MLIHCARHAASLNSGGPHGSVGTTIMNRKMPTFDTYRDPMGAGSVGPIPAARALMHQPLELAAVPSDVRPAH
jgi:hypothetical protein